MKNNGLALRFLTIALTVMITSASFAAKVDAVKYPSSFLKAEDIKGDGVAEGTARFYAHTYSPLITRAEDCQKFRSYVQSELDRVFDRDKIYSKLFLTCVTSLNGVFAPNVEIMIVAEPWKEQWVFEMEKGIAELEKKPLAEGILVKFFTGQPVYAGATLRSFKNVEKGMKIILDQKLFQEKTYDHYLALVKDFYQIGVSMEGGIMPHVIDALIPYLSFEQMKVFRSLLPQTDNISVSYTATFFVSEFTNAPSLGSSYLRDCKALGCTIL